MTCAVAQVIVRLIHVHVVNEKNESAIKSVVIKLDRSNLARRVISRPSTHSPKMKPPGATLSNLSIRPILDRTLLLLLLLFLFFFHSHSQNHAETRFSPYTNLWHIRPKSAFWGFGCDRLSIFLDIV